MASSRRTGTNEQISVLGTDYATAALWESDTDNNLVTAAESEVLECPAGTYAQTVEIYAASTNAIYFRIIRAQPGAGHGGIPGTGVRFEPTSVLTNGAFVMWEHFASIQDISIKPSYDNTNALACGIYGQDNDDFLLVGVIVYDGTNIGSGLMRGLYLKNSDRSSLVNSLILNNDDDHIWFDGCPDSNIYNVTSVGSGAYGISASSSVADIRITNCISSNSVSDDFWYSTNYAESYLSSSDATATGTGSRTNQTFTFVDAANDDYHLSDSDTGALGFGTDLGSDTDFAFDDDIDGNLIVDWSIGFDSDPVAGGITGSLTDTIALTESSVTTASYAASLSDTVALTESSTTTATFPAASSDMIALTDSGATAASGIGALTDTVGVSESSGAVLDLLASASDSASLTESADAVGTLLASASDSISLTESSLTDSASFATSTDTIALTDACVGEASYNPVSTDTIALTDSAEEVSAVLGSSRRTGVNEQINTLGTDYATLTLWEVATDNDLVTAAAAEVLEIPAGTYNDSVSLQSATTNGSYFRIIRPVAGAEHDGDVTSGVRFISTVSGAVFTSHEPYSSVQDLVINNTADLSGSAYAVNFSENGQSVVGVIALDCANIGIGDHYGVQLQLVTGEVSYAVNCLSINTDYRGFQGTGAGGVSHFKNCTAIDSGQYGFRSTHASVVTNFLSTGSVTSDFILDATGTYTNLASGDATADDQGGTGHRISQTFTFVDTITDNYHLANTDAGAKGFGTDLTGDPDFAFNDDIDRNVITIWSIGFDSDPVALASLTDTVALTESSSAITVDLASSADTIALSESALGVFIGSSRRRAINEQVSVLGTDYATMVLWESDTDNDLVTAAQSEVLEIPAGIYDDSVTLLSASTNSSYFRIIRPASGARHNGNVGSGVRIVTTINNSVITAHEDYCSIQDLVITNTANGAGIYNDCLLSGNQQSAVGIISLDSQNLGAGSYQGIYLQLVTSEESFAANCLSINTGTTGFRSAGAGGLSHFKNCTSVDSGANGFQISQASTVANCLSTGAGTLDYSLDPTGTYTNLASGDATADDQGGTGHRISQTFTFVDAVNDNYHLHDSDSGAKGFGLDQTLDADFKFNDDIDGNLVTTWSIGFDSDPPLSASLIDTVALTDSSLGDSSLLASASDTVGLTESVTCTAAYGVNVSESVSLSDASLSALALLASSSDSVVLTDQSLGVLVVLASTSDTVALSESGLSAGVFTALGSDTITLIETSIGNADASASSSDTISLTDAGTVPADYPVSLSDVLTITDTSNGVLTRLVSLIDVIPEDFALYAEQSGLGTVNTNLFRGGLLAKPDAQVCFTLSTGPPPERVLDGRNVVDMPTLRVLVRGAPGDRKGAATTATRVYEMFDGLTGKTIGSNKYQTVFATSPPAPFAIDESGRRPVYSVDFELRIARV